MIEFSLPGGKAGKVKTGKVKTGEIPMKLIKTEDAVGTVLCHDITQIIKGVTKDAVFRKGHIVREEDIPVLLSCGKENLYVYHYCLLSKFHL